LTKAFIKRVRTRLLQTKTLSKLKLVSLREKSKKCGLLIVAMNVKGRKTKEGRNNDEYGF